jgi:4-diphosphocytidyl-2-C-methyl-D-erythritol kinase
MEEIARAKINLALHVRGREADGYHRLETVFAFAEDGDRLNVSEGEGLSLRIGGPFAAALSDSDDNLVLRAARSLQERFGAARGAALYLDKRLPVASGIGGGSADAAAALRLLYRWWGIGTGEAALLDIARTLGADVPACVLSRPLTGTGRGDSLVPLDLGRLAGQPLLLVNPGVGVSTAAVFGRWGGVDGGALPSDLEEARNDLEAPALQLAPVIADVLARLRAVPGAGLVRMSGSGATCFALFESEDARDAAGAQIAAVEPGWWQLATRLA